MDTNAFAVNYKIIRKSVIIHWNYTRTSQKYNLYGIYCQWKLQDLDIKKKIIPSLVMKMLAF